MELLHTGKSVQRQKELDEKYGSEQVLVVPFGNTTIIPDEFKHISSYKNGVKDILSMLNYRKFMLRSMAEENPIFQQIIPYAFFQKDDKFFVTKRLGGESRLTGLISMGIGGHINPCDNKNIGNDAILREGLHRELNEETTILKFKHKIELFGTVRDLTSSTPDHIGIVYKVNILDKRIKNLAVKEKENLEGMWVTKQDMIRDYESYESWAQLIISYLILRH